MKNVEINTEHVDNYRIENRKSNKIGKVSTQGLSSQVKIYIKTEETRLHEAVRLARNGVITQSMRIKISLYRSHNPKVIYYQISNSNNKACTVKLIKVVNKTKLSASDTSRKNRNAVTRFLKSQPPRSP